MTKDDTISIAREVWGDDSGKPWSESALLHLERFAELLEAKVRADEREACAKVCDIESSVNVTNASEQYQEGRSMGAASCAAGIRARGKK